MSTSVVLNWRREAPASAVWSWRESQAWEPFVRTATGLLTIFLVLGGLLLMAHLLGEMPDPAPIYVLAVAFNAYLAGTQPGLLGAGIILLHALLFPQAGQAFDRALDGALPMTVLALTSFGAAILAGEAGTRARTGARLAALLQPMAQHLPDGLALVGQDGRVVLWNPRLAALSGLADHKTLGQSIEQVRAAFLASADDQSILRRAHEAANAARNGATSTFQVRLTTEPPRDLEVATFPLAGQRGPVGHGLLVRDVTANRELDRLKDELLLVVNHEIRNPMVSVVGLAELLLTREYSEQQRRRFLSAILDEGRRLTDLLNNYLDLRRLESGARGVELRPTDLATLVEQVIAATPDDPQRPIAVDLPTRLPRVWGDAEALQQVLTNLLSNARKYSPNGGPIRVAARVVNGAVEVQVVDQGLGLPPEEIPKLFRRFYRVDRPDRRKIKGAGLGLAICRHLISGHGGRVWAESNGPGYGAAFSFTLRLVHAATAPGDALIVEKDTQFARLLERALLDAGLSPLRETSGDSALRVVASAAPQAVVLEPQALGMELQTFMRRLQLGRATLLPTVLFTERYFTADEEEALAALGVVALFRKSLSTVAVAAEETARAAATQQAQAKLMSRS